MSKSAQETRPGRSAAGARCFAFCAVPGVIVLFGGALTARALEPNVALGYAGASPIARQVMRGPETDP
jgi:hypothetical protein